MLRRLVFAKVKSVEDSGDLKLSQAWVREFEAYRKFLESGSDRDSETWRERVQDRQNREREK